MNTFSVKPHLGLSKFLNDASKIVGREFVQNQQSVIDWYARSCSSAVRRSQAVVQPSSVADVQQVVECANKYHVALYPISGGKNWGLGDACPSGENQVIVDLGRMNRIECVDAELGAITVEPGVTQQQIYDFLQQKNLPFWYDSSGAGPSATVLGNLMERGYGHTPLGERFQNSCNYEVVLADGSRINTGFGENGNNAVAHLFKPGLGPSLDGLFTQSNLGIVTRATFWLMRRPEYFEAYVFQLNSDMDLARAVDAIQPLRAWGAIASALHIGNDFRVLSAKTQYPYDILDGTSNFPQPLREKLNQKYGASAWNALGAYYGTRNGAVAFRRDLRKALRGITRPIFLSEKILRRGQAIAKSVPWIPGVSKLLSKLQSADSVVDLLKGKPSAEHLAGAAWRSRTPWDIQSPTPIERGDGLIWHTPAVPCKGGDIERLNQCIDETFAQFFLEPLVTYIMISSRVCVCPITFCYDRNCEIQSRNAHACLEELTRQCEKLGYFPYRGSAIKPSSAPSPLSQILKATLDPNRVLAPNRYGL